MKNEEKGYNQDQHRALPPTGFMAAIVVSALLGQFDLFRIGLPKQWNWAGAILILLGLVLNVLGNSAFKKVGTNIHPLKRSSHLVTTGVFSFSRNPMYLGMVMALAGLTVLLDSYLAVIPAFLFLGWVSRNFVRPEEEKMEREFGKPYLDYKTRVRRWL